MKIFSLFTLSYGQNANYNNCQEKLFETKLDCCKLGASLVKTNILKLFYINVLESANFPLECPYRTGNYSITNFKMSLDKNMPLPNNVSMCMSLKFFGSIKGSKKFFPMSLFRANLRYLA